MTLQRAMQHTITGDFFFEEVDEEDLYYRNAKRAIIEIQVGDTDLKRAVFVHCGHPHLRIPQNDYWTVSDLETGLATGDGETAQQAIEDAKRRFNQDNALVKLVTSVASFIDEYGRANMAANKPVIREESMIFWYEDDDLKWARVKSQRRHLNPNNGVACLITHHPTSVVAMPDIVYVWPELEDLYDA
jgi:hypothetical protein